ncbi:MAG: aldo/keto reductase [Phycisphaeraceae bacterium]|nr:MAG: aldo/keto reductase [Phycisphaeraceae bacterium]
MRYHTLGDSDVRVSEIGFGCWTMGGPNFDVNSGNPIGWADVNEEDVLAGIRAGLDAGVTHFDNADIYGNGRAERMLADCLHKLGVRREDVVIATKIGHSKGTAPHAYEPFHLRHQCEQSLRNLQTDYIDIYYLHHDFFGPDNGPGNLHDAAATMHALRQEGKVRVIGQSSYSEAGFVKSAPVLRPSVFQSWANLIEDNFICPGSTVQKVMSEHNISFIAFGPVGKGVLLDKFDPENPPTFEAGDVRTNNKAFKGEYLKRLKPALERVKAKHGPTTEDLASVCCRFVAGHDHVAGVIPGFRNEKQARCNVRGGTDEPLSESEVAELRDMFAPLQLPH